MKYCVVIMDGAAGWPLPEHSNLTCLEMAQTPNLDAMAREGRLALAQTVPEGMEPSSAIACMAVLGYNPAVYYRGRAAIEAISMGIPLEEGDVVFRCNLVTVRHGIMESYSAGHISTEEAKELVEALNKKLGTDKIHIYPGVNYRHILKIKGRGDTLGAICTPPHDISDKPVAEYLPHGPGSDILLDLMHRSEEVLRNNPINQRRAVPATTIWFCWGTGKIPQMPPFLQKYGLRAALTSGVDLLRGLAIMSSMDVLNIPGVTDVLDNDYTAQADGALKALSNHDLVVIHVEAPDESGHAGSVEEKVESIHRIDEYILSRLRAYKEDKLRVLVMPDHPTPIKIKTHTPEPVPFLLWGAGVQANGAIRMTEAEAQKTLFPASPAYDIMGKLIQAQIKDNK